MIETKENSVHKQITTISLAVVLLIGFSPVSVSGADSTAIVDFDSRAENPPDPVEAEAIAMLKIGSPEFVLYGKTNSLIVTTTTINNRTLVSADFIGLLLVHVAEQKTISGDAITTDFLAFDQEANTVTITWYDKNIVITIGELLDGMDVPAQFMPVDHLPEILHVVLPLRFICETLGFSVEWDGVDRTVYIFD
jgi:hypothetical protein